MESRRLAWNATSKVGSLNNVKHKAGENDASCTSFMCKGEEEINLNVTTSINIMKSAEMYFYLRAKLSKSMDHIRPPGNILEIVAF